MAFKVQVSGTVAVGPASAVPNPETGRLLTQHVRDLRRRLSTQMDRAEVSFSPGSTNTVFVSGVINRLDESRSVEVFRKAFGLSVSMTTDNPDEAVVDPADESKIGENCIVWNINWEEAQLTPVSMGVLSESPTPKSSASLGPTGLSGLSP